MENQKPPLPTVPKLERIGSIKPSGFSLNSHELALAREEALKALTRILEKNREDAVQGEAKPKQGSEVEAGAPTDAAGESKLA